MKSTSIHSCISPFYACSGIILRWNHSLCFVCWENAAGCAAGVPGQRLLCKSHKMLSVWHPEVGQAQLGWHCQDQPCSTQLSRVDWNLDTARSFHQAAAGNPCIILWLADWNSWLRGQAFPPKHTGVLFPYWFFPESRFFFFSLAE